MPSKQTEAQKNKQKDARLQKTYGISLSEYNQMLREQNGGCAICGWIPVDGKRMLAVEHDHPVAKAKVYTKKDGDGRIAWSKYTVGNGASLKKSLAIREVKHQSKRISIRGLTCWRCNSVLARMRDNSELLHKAGRYLEEYQEKLMRN